MKNTGNFIFLCYYTYIRLGVLSWLVILF